MTRQYGDRPIDLGKLNLTVREMMFFQYLPIKMAGATEIVREQRLSPFDSFIGKGCCDFVGRFGLNRFVGSYVYLTAKRLYQGPGMTFNRPGWHTDGFGTTDINYIWSDCMPTEFADERFHLSDSDTESMIQMEQQAQFAEIYKYDDNTVLCLDQYVVHRVAIPIVPHLRTFCKLSISSDKYDLEGNSHNSLLEYNWPMRERRAERNIPQG